jgi:hypothetical protein
LTSSPTSREFLIDADTDDKAEIFRQLGLNRFTRIQNSRI